MTVFPARILLANGNARDKSLAIRAAVDLCERTDAELHVARVVRALPPHVYPDRRPEEYEDVYARQVEDAPSRLPGPSRTRAARWLRRT